MRQEFNAKAQREQDAKEYGKSRINARDNLYG